MPYLWSNVGGTVYDNEKLSTESRIVAPLQTTLLDAVDPAGDFNLGKKSGDKIGYRTYGRISGTHHTPILETQKIPYTKAPEYHGTGQVYRYGVGTPWTGTREDLDRLDTEAPIIRSLKDSSARTHNKLINDKLVAGRSFTYVATGTSGSPTTTFLDDGTVAATASSPYSLFHLRKLKLKAKQYNMPPADGKNYWFYISPIMEDDFFNDVGDNGYIDVAKYAPSGAEGALAGEIGKVSGVRHMVDNDVIADGIGTSSLRGSGFFLGEEAIKELLVYPSHFRACMDVGHDFGNNQAIAWQSLLGYVVPWNYTSKEQGSLVHYTSA